MLAGMDSVVAAAADGERALGSTLVSDAALLALWPSTDSGDEDLGEDAQVDAVIRTGSVTPTGEAEVREPAEEGGTADQDLIATGCASITERAFCQRLQCPIGPVLHLTDSEASWGENRSPWSQCGDNDEAVGLSSLLGALAVARRWADGALYKGTLYDHHRPSPNQFTPGILMV